MQRAATDRRALDDVPAAVHDVLRMPGHPLDPQTRELMEARIGQLAPRGGTAGAGTPGGLSIGAIDSPEEAEAERVATRIGSVPDGSARSASPDPLADPVRLFGRERQVRAGATIMGQRGRAVQHEDGTIVLYPEGSNGHLIYRQSPGGSAYEFYGEDGEKVENVFIVVETDEVFGATGAATP